MNTLFSEKDRQYSPICIWRQTRQLTEFLLRKKITGLAYETLEKNGTLPLLSPMSEIAGRMAPLVGAFYLQKVHNGTGVLPSGTTTVRPAKALILGAGVVGSNAARVSVGIGMETVVINKGVEKLQRIDEMFMGRVKTLSLTAHQVREEVRDADIIIGAVLVPGGRTPVLITREMLKIMKPGAVIIDVSIDQGGCAETSRPTTHDNPVYAVDGIIHYAVANMPGAYPRTSTLALTNATLPYVKNIADIGIEKTIRESPAIKTSLNTYRGDVMNKSLADAIRYGIYEYRRDEKLSKRSVVSYKLSAKSLICAAHERVSALSILFLAFSS